MDERLDATLKAKQKFKGAANQQPSLTEQVQEEALRPLGESSCEAITYIPLVALLLVALCTATETII